MNNQQHQSTNEMLNQIRNTFANSSDVFIKKFVVGETDRKQIVHLIYAEGFVDTKSINDFVLPRLKKMAASEETDRESWPRHLDWTPIEKLDEVPEMVFSGQLIICFEARQKLLALDIANPPKRDPQESNTEMAIKGPRDGFVEEAITNVALIRKRLITASLCNETFIIGKRSRTYVALLYIQDIANPQLINEVKQRLKRIDVDALIGAGQLEKMLADQPSSLIPLLDYTGRPDFAADCLVRGRIALVVDGSPIVIIAPTNLTLLLKSPEDLHFPYYFATLGVILRLAGLMIALFLPGFWVAATVFNIEQIPYTLLATIALSRIGLPFPGPLEAFMMISLFELFREAGERMPKAVGQTIAVVGGIVIGDAAIRAGLVSATMLVVSAVTAIASFTLVNQSLVGTVTVMRFIVLIFSSMFGMYGFILSVIALIFYLSTLKSFGIPFLAPLSPFNLKDAVASVFRKPWQSVHQRPAVLKTTDKTRNGDGSS